MKNKDLVALLQTFDPEMDVRYEYDTGYDYPTFIRAYKYEADGRPDYGQFICLDENEPRKQ